MNDKQLDIAATLFLLPPDAKLLPISELSARLRARIGPVEEGQSVITRPGYRVTTWLVPGPLTELLREFASPSLLTDAILRFARDHEQDPAAMLDMAFDALATLVEARVLVPEDSPDALAPAPSLGAGQEVAGFEIDSLVRSLEDSEVYRARGRDGELVALKIGRDGRPAVAAAHEQEARVLERLAGADSPKLIARGVDRGLTYIAMEWCDGVSIAVAAQQARAARDRRRLHGIVSRMLDAYGRLHEKAVLHGDIHPGNCLVRDDGRIVILDFGNARFVNGPPAEVDVARTGIPQFFDPQMAGALLAGNLPPPLTPAAEQYSIAVLAYLSLTGLHPIEAPAVHDELLRRIAERAPLPFSARGVAAWPDVEAVIGNALARQPELRFGSVAGMARAFASAELPPAIEFRRAPAAKRAFDTCIAETRDLAQTTESAHERAWFAARAAITLEDAELLAAADILAGRAGTGWAAQSIAAHVAYARSDGRSENKAIAGFLADAEALPDGPPAIAAIVAAAGVFEGAAHRTTDAAALVRWAAQRLDRLMRAAPAAGAARTAPMLAYAELSLVNIGAIQMRPDLPEHLASLTLTRANDLWLWCLAHDVLGGDRYRALALAAGLPRRPLWRGLSLLRLHQLTGDLRYLAKANTVLARAPNTRLSKIDTALLTVELMAPERAILPPGVVPGLVTSGWKSS